MRIQLHSLHINNILILKIFRGHYNLRLALFTCCRSGFSNIPRCRPRIRYALYQCLESRSIIFRTWSTPRDWRKLNKWCFKYLLLPLQGREQITLDF